MGSIIRSNNTIFIKEDIRSNDSHYLFCTIYKAIEEKSYKDLILDFSLCDSIFPQTMMSLCSYTMNYQKKGCSFLLVHPRKDKIERLFKNSNWSHLIDPERNPPSTFSGYRQVPATVYTNPSEQEDAIQKVISSLLSSYPGLERDAFSAIEWSIFEIMDNVLVHSESEIGGIVQLTTYNNFNRKIEIIVSDAGIGIPNTLKYTNDEIDTDIKALMYCIKEGVTNGKGQGNGLFGTFNICNESKGSFSIDSGKAVLYANHSKGLHIKPNRIPMLGSTITAIINCNTEQLLKKALNFKNKNFSPVDFIEKKYEMTDEIVFEVNSESDSVGSRIAAIPVRNRLYNLIDMTEDTVYINFNDINIASSSFLDELIVKLIIEIGPDRFKQRCKIINLNTTIIDLLSKSYFQRTDKEIMEVIME